MSKQTEYADERGLEPVEASTHGYDDCPNCGCPLVVENDHGTVDELDIECANCGRVRDRKTMPNHFEEQ